MKAKITSLLSRACVIFTLIVFFFYLLASVVSDAARPVMDLLTLLSLFALSLVVSFSFLLLSARIPR
ncbi:MAG: hypothetical protein II771_03740, partial [Clostridia bacterium]|nr:hypothetical protein [Clostridia bacterium]